MKPSKDWPVRRGPGDDFAPMMPLVRAVSREKIRLNIDGPDRGQVWLAGGDEKPVAVDDLLAAYNGGERTVGEVVLEIRARLGRE